MIPPAGVSSISLHKEGSEETAVHFQQFYLITMKVIYIRNVTFNARFQLNTKHKYANSSTVYHVFPTHATETLTFPKIGHGGRGGGGDNDDTWGLHLVKVTTIHGTWESFQQLEVICTRLGWMLHVLWKIHLPYFITFDVRVNVLVMSSFSGCSCWRLGVDFKFVYMCRNPSTFLYQNYIEHLSIFWFSFDDFHM
jgi:hypothetical protein